MERTKISILQVWASRDKGESARRVERLAARASGDILVLPEYAMLDPTGLAREDLLRASEPLEGPWTRMLARIAREKEACVIGTLFESPESGGKPYNSVVLIERDGSIVGTYRKTHLFDALGYKESALFQAGSRLPRVTELCGVRIGVAICFEIRFPELFRLQALAGAELFVVPSGWYKGPAKEEAFEYLAKARAHENTSYLAGAVLAGERFTGRSIVVDPYGVARARAGWREEVLEAWIEPALLEDARRDLPLLGLRREDLYTLEYKD